MLPIVYFVLGGAAALFAPRIYKGGIKIAVGAIDTAAATSARIKEDVDDARHELKVKQASDADAPVAPHASV